MSIPSKIFKALRKRYGKFTSKLIYENNVYKLNTQKGVFVLKLMRDGETRKRIRNEIEGRDYFKSQILPLFKRIRITELDYWNFKDKYIVTKYEPIITFRDLADKKPKEFSKVIRWIYADFFPKFKKLGKSGKTRPNRLEFLGRYPSELRKEAVLLNEESAKIARTRKAYTLYKEFSLYDLNYRKPFLYFIDFEDLKKNADYLLDYTDLFAKIFKGYLKNLKGGTRIYKKTLKDILISSKKNLSKQEIKIFELYFKMRLLKFYLQDPKYKKEYLSSYKSVKEQGLEPFICNLQIINSPLFIAQL